MATDATTENATDTPSKTDGLDTLTGEAIKALRSARDDCRVAQWSCEAMLAAVDEAINRDAVRVGMLLAIRGAAEFALRAMPAKYRIDTKCAGGPLLAEADAAIKAVEERHAAALQTILAAANSIVGPRDEVDECNNPIGALQETARLVGKVVASLKPADGKQFSGGDDIPF